MSKQITQSFKSINWDQFLQHGLVIQSPDSHTIWGGYGQSDSGDLSFFHTPFYSKKTSFYTPAVVFQIDLESFIQEVERRLAHNIKLQLIETEDEPFYADICQVIEDIEKSQTLLKVVPVSSASYSGTLAHPLGHIRGFSQLGGWIYGRWQEGKGILGCSPEYLFDRSSDCDKFFALAGTHSTDKSGAEKSLLSSRKDQEEHQFVVEDITSKLKPFRPINWQVGSTETVKFGHLIHLRTKLRANPLSCGIEDLVACLHPTAALGGFPAEESLAYLRTLHNYAAEKESRQFGGILGFKQASQSFALVQIRSIEWDRNKYKIQSGCGVVSESCPESELEEIKQKRKTIENIFS